MAARPTLRAYGLCLLSGVLYFLGFAGFDLWPLALIALVPLFFALERCVEPGGPHLARLALFYGLVVNLGGYYWLVETLETFSGFPTVLCILFSSVLCLYQGGLIALACFIWVRARRRGWGAQLAALVAFAAAETVFPLLFENYYANSFHQLPIVMQVAELGGPVLLTALAALFNATVYDVLRLKLARQRIPLRTVFPTAVAVAASIGFGAVRISMVDDSLGSFPELKVGIIQTSMGSYLKREDPLEGVRRHQTQSLKVETEEAPDLLVWPESAFTFFLPEHITNVKEHVLGPVSTPLLFGGLAKRRASGRLRDYNTAFLTDADGNITGSYDKSYLLAFGEYIPFGDRFPALYEISKYSGRFTPGTRIDPLEFRGFRLGVLVCYEDILPTYVRKVVRHGDPHLLVNVTNDSWFGQTTEPWIHLALAKFRAIEHRRFLVRATNTGVSAVVDPVGRVLTHSGVFTRENLVSNVRMMSGTTVYGLLGNWPGWAAVLAALGVFFWPRRRSETHGK